MGESKGWFHASWVLTEATRMTLNVSDQIEVWNDSMYCWGAERWKGYTKAGRWKMPWWESSHLDVEQTDLFHFEGVWCFAWKTGQALEFISLNWILLSSSVLDWPLSHTGRRSLPGQHGWLRPLFAQESLGRMMRCQAVTGLRRPMRCRRRQMTLGIFLCHSWYLCSILPCVCRGDRKFVCCLQWLWCSQVIILSNVLLWTFPEKFTYSSSMFFGFTPWGSLHTFSFIFLFSFVLQGVNIVQQRRESAGHVIQYF